VPAERAEQLLEELFDAQLVEVASAGPLGIRWRLHDLLRVYARELAADERERGAAVERLLGACLTLAEEARQRGISSAYFHLRRQARHRSFSPGPVAALVADPGAWFEGERRFLAGAVELACAADQAERAWELADALGGLFDLAECLDDWRHVTELALAAAEAAGDPRGEAVLRCQLAWRDAKRDLPAAAIAGFERARTLFEQIGDGHGAAVADASVGVLHVPLGRYDVAAERLPRVLPLLRETADLQTQAYVLRGMGSLHLDLGRADEAAGCFAEALELARRTGYRYAEANILRWLAAARMDQGRADEAAALAADCMDVFRQLGSRVGMAIALLAQGKLDVRRGRLGPAMTVLRRCLLIAEEAGDVITQADARHQMGRVCLAESRHEQAILHLRQALATAEPTGRPLIIGRVLADLGDAHEAAGERREARSCHDRALRLFQQMGVPEAGPLAGRPAPGALPDRGGPR
jgi:tetratricopeptide (TPR) repeat protein